LVFAGDGSKLANKTALIQIEIFFLCHFFVTAIVTDRFLPGSNVPGDGPAPEGSQVGSTGKNQQIAP
jgi:hypothetical protein